VQEHHTTSPPRFETSMLAARIDRCACNRFAGRTPKWIGIVHLSCLVKYIIKIGIAGLPGGTCPVIFRRRLREPQPLEFYQRRIDPSLRARELNRAKGLESHHENPPRCLGGAGTAIVAGVRSLQPDDYRLLLALKPAFDTLYHTPGPSPPYPWPRGPAIQGVD
jgi:hypothetical protein